MTTPTLPAAGVPKAAWLLLFFFLFNYPTVLKSQCENEIKNTMLWSTAAVHLITQEADRRCQDSLPGSICILPLQEVAGLNTLLGQAFPNTIYFQMCWAPIGSSTSVFTNPPDSIDCTPAQGVTCNDLEDPKWQHLWEFSDGCYIKGDSIGIHTFGAQATGVNSSSIKVRAVPTYSPTGEPPEERRKATTDIIGGTTLISNFKPDEPDRDMKITPHWDAMQKREVFTLAVSYRNLRSSTRNGTLSIHFGPEEQDSSGFKVDSLDLDKNFRFYGNDLPRTRTDNRLDLAIEALSPDKEHTFFIDIPVSSNLPNTSGETAELNISYGIDWEGEEKDSIEVIPSTNSDRLPSPSIDTRDSVKIIASLPVIDDKPRDERDTYAFDNPNYNVFKQSLNLSVNIARDPNSISVSPSVIFTYDKNAVLTYTVKFMNKAMSKLARVEVTTIHDKKLAYSNVDLLDHQRKDVFIEAPSPTSSLTLPHQQIWDLRNSPNDLDKARWLAHGEVGSIQYTVPLDARTELNPGDQIHANANIKMYTDPDGAPDDELATNTAITRVVEPKPLPWCFGVKWGLNFQNFNLDNDNTIGMMTGLTARKAIEGKNRSYYSSKQKKIKVSQLPRLWYQFELMYSHLKIEEDFTSTLFRYRSIDVVPLQVRYVFDIKRIKRLGYKSAAVSAGLNFPLVLDADTDENPLRLSDNFFDRWEQNVFLDLGVGNILGRHGFSFSYRFNWRLNPIINDGGDIYHQLYTHFNF
ncbi:MAG: hypothetical protein AAGG75_25445 [Bacteroidota bacterium]